MKVTKEKPVFKVNGFMMFLILVVVIGLSIFCLVKLKEPNLFCIGLIFLASIGWGGFYTVQPNEARVLNFFGKYTGSIREDGFWWSNPFAIKRRISLRIRNFESQRLKVNDAHGNPIEIAAVIVWKVIDSASAIFDVDDYETYVAIQSETAIRTLCSHFPYDTTDNTEDISLRAHPVEVAETLKRELESRMGDAGVEVIEARLSHLAYAQEIAQVMLRKQQAQAIISARQKIVEGAVGMVEMALKQLSDNKIVDLDDERRATMVNNLLVTLVSENETRQVINTGTIY
jgi:regulator of protease activity HflC (stomatin/prohibitin superfamily)